MGTLGGHTCTVTSDKGSQPVKNSTKAEDTR